jgi:hypothetical protein
MTEKPANGKPAYYAWAYWWLVPIAKRLGYALALHGSLARDLDIVAVPWTEDAAPPEALVKALAGAFKWEHDKKPTRKPHGRMAWRILMVGGAYIDLSVMPRRRARRKDAR